jgi:RNA polymerase sigma-70 factor, ECF subfamily
MMRSRMTPPAAKEPTAGAAPQGEEAALLARLRGGDRAAFAALVGRHGAALLRFALTFVRDRSVAEEVVQDTWMAALDSLDGFEGRSSLRTWLFQIAANRARTRFAREGRSVAFSALGSAGPGGERAPGADDFDAAGGWREPPGRWSEESPERLALGRETQAAIEAAIAGLPEAQRAVITLRDVDGLETEEICSLLGITVTNQRVLLHRARMRVREALRGYLGEAT